VDEARALEVALVRRAEAALDTDLPAGLDRPLSTQAHPAVMNVTSRD
jgi:hypothetical protein